MSRIAIIGMACLFPGAPNLERYWKNITEGVDAIGDVPPERWDPSFYDPDSKAIDRFYCKRGGFVDDYTDFDPLAFGVMPKAADVVEPDQLLTLKIGHDALRDAGYAERAFARDRTGVVIGRGNYVGAGVLRLEQHVRLLPQIMQTLEDLFPGLDDSALAAARERLQKEFSYYGPDVAAGMIPNLLASRLANRLDLHGPAFTVDAACASSLIAIEQSCAALSRGETDLMLAGGVHLTHDLTFWATFCQLGALSRSGVVRPLAENADGILAGEGVGMAVLKRLDDALADGDRVYAVIEGVASSSDGRSSSLIAPSVSGQQIALEKAWSQVDFDRDALGLIEAHGTGTPTGDAVELETLGQFFGPWQGPGERPVIGSVKSMIGHAMPASGMASLIKTALSVYHGVLPPTLHCETPHPRMAQTRFRPLSQAESWPRPREQRIAGVNAFGFGGINAHMLLRGVPESEVQPMAAVSTAPELPEVLLLSADSPEALLARLDNGERDNQAGKGTCRLVIIAPNARKLKTARKAVAAGKPWRGRQQIWFTPSGLISEGGRIAFMFPGVDSTFQPQATDLAAYFDQPLPPHCESLNPADSLTRVVLGLLGFNRFMFDRLAELNIHADAFAGHSVGEWSAMLCAGMMDQALSDRTNADLDVDAMKFPDVQFLAAACDKARLLDAMDGLPRIALSHDNCPHQVIACGARSSIASLAERLGKQGVFATMLPIVSGFHSPLFSGHMGWYREFFGAAELKEPAKPVWSATTAAPFPKAMDDKRQLALSHLLEPVRFRELTEALYAEGCRVFVEVGTGSLTGFVADTLSGRPHLTIRSNHESRSGLEQLQSLSAALWVEGLAFDTRLLQSAVQPAIDCPTVAASSRKLSLGVPLVRVREPLNVALLPEAATGGLQGLPAVNEDDVVGQMMRDTLADIEQAGREVFALWQQHRNGETSSTADRPLLQHAAAVPVIDCRVQRLLDIDSTIPYVADHELYPQREGWPIRADRHPVVPMTMEVMLVREAVEEQLPGLKVVEVSDIQAYNWLVVAEPVTVDISLQSVDDARIDVEIVGYFKARVRVARDYPAAEVAAMPALQQPRATEVSVDELYREGWMFHGPAYQGVQALQAIGDNGIDGELKVPSGKGSLLDNMGQLAGYWVMEQPNNCLAMPIGVDSIRFYAPDPQPGEITQAQVRIAELDELNCVSHHQLRDPQGRLRVAIDGWRTRRYQMDKAFWVASRKLSQLQVSQAVPPNVALFEDRYDTAILRDYLSRRYLTESERQVYETLSPRRRRAWLNGRVAAKDAVRHWLQTQRGFADIYPQEICVENADTGMPVLRANVSDRLPESLHISISHKGNLAAAIVGEQPVGIDIETIEARDQGFVDLAFTAPECERLLTAEAASTAYTRGWVAKEVVAKAQGSGLGGRPSDFVIQARDGDCLCVNGRWVVTHQVLDHIVGWSLPMQMVASHDSAAEQLQVAISK